MRRITRRAFLAGSLVVVGGAGVWWATRDHIEDLIVRILRRQLYYLDVDEADLRAYAGDLTARTSLMTSSSTRAFSLVNPVYSIAPESVLDADARIGVIEDEIVTGFLLSSDFFMNGEDESRPVTYIAYYEPGLVPCFNPLLRRL